MTYMSNLIFALLVTLSAQTVADSVECGGLVTIIMANSSSCADTSGVKHLAYRTDKTTNNWLCTETSAGSSMVLAAYIASKPVSVTIPNQTTGTTCGTLQGYWLRDLNVTLQ